MAFSDVLLPTQSEVIVDSRGVLTRKFRDFLAQLATTTSDAALQAQITALDVRVEAIEASGGDVAHFVQGTGIQIIGQITDPTIRISLSAYLADLLDVSAAAPADRDRLTWNATTEEWEPTVILNPDLSAADTDGLDEGLTNFYFTAARVRATILTGLSLVSSAAITATDTVLSALGKLQAQITALAATVGGLIVQTITNGDTTHAPSGDVVFDALALKAPIASPSFTGPVEMVFGSGNGLTLRDNTTDATTKDSRILVGHFTNAEESIAAFGGASGDPASFVPGNITGSVATSGNVVRFGGGFGIQNAANSLRFYTAATPTSLSGSVRWAIDDSGHLRTGADNAYTLGSASNRPSVLWAATGTISTSDAREKTEPRDLTATELECALDLARLPCVYQWLSAIELKGEDARLHCGPTVQAVISCMESHGLDPFRWGFVCYDEWAETPEVVEEVPTGTVSLPDGTVLYENEPEYMANGETQWTQTGIHHEVTQEYRPAGDRYSLRPSELAHFIMRGIVANQDAMNARLAALESE